MPKKIIRLPGIQVDIGVSQTYDCKSVYFGPSITVVRLSEKKWGVLAKHDNYGTSLSGYVNDYNYTAVDVSWALAELGLWSQEMALKFAEQQREESRRIQECNEVGKALDLLIKFGYISSTDTILLKKKKQNGNS